MNRRQLLAALSGAPLLGARDICTDWVGTCGTVVSPIPDHPLPFTPGSDPVMPRPLASGSYDWNRLASAYKLWFGLRPNDPCGPCSQRDIHSRACGEPDDVHHSWYFLPWHRAFIYFHERILERLLNENGSPGPFRLPTWDWEKTLDLPQYYDQRWAPGFCLHSCVAFNTYFCSVDLSPANLALWLQTDGSNSFAGTPGVAPGSAGRIHIDIHTAISNVMGVFTNAALDPIFYAHHTNVDRFFEYWKTIYRNDWNNLKSDTGWLGRSFDFFDARGQACSVKVSDLLETAPLGYAYAPPQTVPVAIQLPTLGPDRLRFPLPLNQRLIVRINSSGVTLNPGRYSLKLRTKSRPIDIGAFGIFTRHHSTEINLRFIIRPALALPANRGEFAIVPVHPAGRPILLNPRTTRVSFELISLGSPV
jgi:polyphenol oxidase